MADVPASAYSYVFDGQAQTLDQLFVNAALHDDLIQIRAAHINADWAAADEANGSMGSSDHDPQVARFQQPGGLSVADARVEEGDSGTTALTFPVTLSRPLSRPVTVCATALPGTALADPGLRPVHRLQGRSPPARPARRFTVRVRGDRWREPDETLTLRIGHRRHNVRTADATATGTIRNDD